MRYLLCTFAGLVAGFSLAAALNALGVPARIALYWGDKKLLPWLSAASALGTSVSAFFTMSGLVFPIGGIACACMLLVMGMFLGYSAMSLAETLDVYALEAVHPKTLVSRVAILGIALGKLTGSLCYFLLWEGWL